MKTLITTRGTAIVFNPEDQSVKYIDNDRNSVDSVRLIDEECDVKAIDFDKDNKEVEITMHAQPGDILVRFWERDFPARYILVKSDEWKTNIETYRATEQKRKEEWAAKNSTAKEPEVGECNFQKAEA